MRSVRCDVCGTKALMAASTCPKCGHGFGVRDGFGELLPLAHCPACDSYYPLAQGECRWCHTKPERAPIAPRVLKGVGAAVLVGMAWGAWMVRGDAPASGKPARQYKPVLTVESVRPESLPPDRRTAVARREAVAQAGKVDVADSTEQLATTSTDVVAGEPADSASQAVATDGAQQDSAAAADSAPAEPPVEPTSVAESPPAALILPPSAPASRSTRSEMAKAPAETSAPGGVSAAERPVRPTPSATQRTLAKATPTKVPSAKAKSPAPRTAAAKSGTSKSAASKSAPPKAVAAKPSTPSRSASAKAPSAARRRSAWVSSVARRWVVVRADPSHGSRIVASIGPSTRVQLGEVRGAWRRIRAKGLAGWVEHRSFAWVAVPGSSGRLAAR